ncbi:MAG: alkyl hydroperoxide reductase subunit F, partial [Azonexaceae bacterium]|nr:alkyl hydroperoxide reductase subunit F [Azonexaceae bacterium]
MLDTQVKEQLKAYLERLQRPIELVAALGDDAGAQEMRALLDDIVACSAKVSLREEADARVPSFGIAVPGEAARIRFAGL